MSQVYAKEYEDYLITEDEESLKSLIPGSIEQRYISLVNRLKKEKFTKELKEEVEKFVNDFTHINSIRLKVLSLVKEYAASPENKTEILNKLFSLLNVSQVMPISKPVHYNRENTNENEKHYPSKLDESENLALDDFLDKIYSKQVEPNNNFLNSTLKNQSEIFIDISKIPNELFIDALINDIYSQFRTMILFSIKITPLRSFKEKFTSLINSIKSNKQGIMKITNFLRNTVNNFLNEQIEFLLTFKEEKDFSLDFLINELINRKFAEKTKTKIEKKEVLLKINELLDQKSMKYNSVKRDVLLNILWNDATMNIFDKNLFLEYLECPCFNSDRYHISQQIREQILINNKKRVDFTENIKVYDDVKEGEIIEKYLNHFFFYDNIPISEFEKFFNHKYINKIYYKNQILLGKKINPSDYLDSEEIEEIIKKVILEICDYNKEKFDINEDIELYLNIKNIQTLFVKIYEINTENYYLNKKSPFDCTISVDGIIPTMEETYQYIDNPQILSKKKIVLDKIPKKRGLFIVELIGSGYSSRAAIQRGELTLIHKNTTNGTVFYILDEYQKICKGDNTGIWMKEQWFPSLENGAILIPYQKSESQEFLIFKHDNFSNYENMKIPTEKYKLDGMWILNNESIIMGNICKCLVRANLYVNDQYADISNLTNVNVKVSIIKSENNQDIPINITFDNVKLSDDKEYEFEFQVPPKLKFITFTLSGVIQPKSQKEKINLTINKKMMANEVGITNPKLKVINNDYIVEILGKNGEPQKNLQVDVKINHKYFKKDNKILLESDSNGQINLGKLNNVDSIYVIDSYFSMKKKDISYFKEYTIIKGDELSLPLTSNKNVYLFKQLENKKQIIENLSSKCIFNYTDYKENHCYCTIKNLDKGTYCLQLGMVKIDIIVVEGKIWNEADFIITDSYIQERECSKEPISVNKIKYMDNKLSIKLNSKEKSNARVHITAFQYFNNGNKDIVDDFKSLDKYNLIQSNVKFKFNSFVNNYLNNKILHEEIQYIINRKQYEKILGNSLEKPSLLVKSQFIQDTETDIKEAKGGKEYEAKENRESWGNDDRSTSRADKESISSNIIFFNDFIHTPPFSKSNLQPDDTGNITLECDLSNYSNIEVICIDNTSCYQEIYSLNNMKTEMNDLRMKSTLKDDKTYCELRKVHHLKNEQTHFISDITSVKYQLFDSLEKFSTYLKLVINSNLQAQFDKFEFLFNFDNLGQKEKLQKVSELFSHELNIYLYFHHHDFFNEYIYPLLKFKIDKTFIDYFLLNDIENINKFTTPENIDDLNAFERCLLIYSIRETKPQLAMNIAKTMTTEVQQNPIAPEEMKRLFNTALNIKLDKAEIITTEDKDKDKEKVKDMVEKKEPTKDKKIPQFLPEEFAPSKDLFDVKEEQASIANAKNNLFTDPGKSKEYCETQYYNVVYNQSTPSTLVKNNPFFTDLANYWAENTNSYLNKGFFTENFLITPSNLHELIFSLSVLDLSTKSIPQAQTFKKDNGLGLTIEANTNSYLLTKEISEAKFNESNNKGLNLAQIITTGEKDNNDDDDKEPSYFLSNNVYTLKTIVTNISNRAFLSELLMQIPEGSIPLYSSDYTVVETINLGKFKSADFTQTFYFPQPGKFVQYPPSASFNGTVISKGQPRTFEVLSSPPKNENAKTLDDVLEQGGKKEILEFIKSSDDLNDNELNKILWMLSDEDFYKQLNEILRNKLVFNEIIWQHGINFKDIQTIKEYIEYLSNKEILSQLGPYTDIFFLHLDKTNNYKYNNHKDYYPIINSRIHKLPQAENKILTVEFRETYHNYISYLITLDKLDNLHLMRLCYYLILQQRIEEAVKIYDRIDLKEKDPKSSMVLQYDYITAYLDFSVGYPKFEKARAIVTRYKDFPLKEWKDMFNEINDQLNEYDEIEMYENIDEVLDEGKTKVKEEEEYINVSIQDKKISILYKNLSKIDVKFYLIDVEILFSRTPFMTKTTNDFSLVMPSSSLSFPVEKKINESTLEVDIPKEYESKNLFFEVSGGKLKEFNTYYSSLLKCSISESLGEVKVLSPKLKPLPKVYVKAFCETDNGEIKFYKDGYTDLRGRFNFVANNSDLIMQVKKFAILIISEKFGSIIRECKPPKIIRDKVNDDGSEFTGYEQFQNYRQDVKKTFIEKNNE